MPNEPNHDDERERRHQHTVFRGRLFGQQVEVTGQSAIYILVLLTMCGGSFWLLFHYVEASLTFSREQEQRLVEQSRAVIEAVHQQDDLRTDEHTQLKRAVDKLSDTMDETNYLSTLPKQERERLQLNIPHSLRQKLRALEGR